MPLIANGGIGEHADVQKCLDATGAAAVMSSEALLENPALFVGNRDGDGAYLDQDERRRTSTPRRSTSPGKGIAIVKGHLFKVVRGLRQHTALREALLDARDLAAVRDVVDRIADAGWEQPGHSLPGGGFRLRVLWYHRHRTAEAVGVQRAAERAERPPPSREEAESARARAPRAEGEGEARQGEVRLSKHARAKALRRWRRRFFPAAVRSFLLWE